MGSEVFEPDVSIGLQSILDLFPDNFLEGVNDIIDMYNPGNNTRKFLLYDKEGHYKGCLNYDGHSISSTDIELSESYNENFKKTLPFVPNDEDSDLLRKITSAAVRYTGILSQANNSGDFESISISTLDKPVYRIVVKKLNANDIGYVSFKRKDDGFILGLNQTSLQPEISGKYFGFEDYLRQEVPELNQLLPN